MTTATRLTLTLTALLAACGQAPTSSPPPTHPGAAIGSLSVTRGTQRLVVTFREGTPREAIQAAVQQAGGHLDRTLGDTAVALVDGDRQVQDRLMTDELVMATGAEQYRFQSLIAFPDSETASITTLSPAADPGSALQWYLRRVGAPQAAQRVGAALQDVTVGLLDTGVMSDHPDLAGQVRWSVDTAYCQETGPDGTAGYPVYTKVADLYANPAWTPGDECATYPAVYGAHGTMTAGVLAAKIGGGDLIGTAPGVNLEVYKIFDRVRYPDANGQPVTGLLWSDGAALQAITDAADRGVDILNMSLGFVVDRELPEGTAAWLAYKRVTNLAARKGTLIVAAALNGATNTNGSLATLPADLPAVMGVSATGVLSVGFDTNGLLVPTGPDVPAFYTNSGAAVAIAAPGGDCGTNPATGGSWCDLPVSARPADWFRHQLLTTTITPAGTPGYTWGMGTSGAAPIVAGVAALVKAQHPEYSANQLRAHLQRTADKVGPPQVFGSGVVNAERATR